jgi:hypothetical protein
MTSADEQRRRLLYAAQLRAIDAALSAGKHTLALRGEICNAATEEAIAEALAKAGVIVAPENGRQSAVS